MKNKTFYYMLILALIVSYQALFAKQTVTTRFNSEPQGANFIIKGINYDSFAYTTPKTLNLRPGAVYTLTFSKPGYQTKIIQHQAGQGNVFVRLDRIGGSGGKQTVTTHISSDPGGADFIIDGVNYDSYSYTTPKTLNLRADRVYELTFSKSGYKTVTLQHRAGSGRIHVDLKKDQKNYQLTVDANVNGAKVMINGSQYGNTPLRLKLEKGSYRIKVSLAGYEPFQTRIELKRNQEIYARLIPIKKVKLYLPKGAKVWIDGQLHKIKWKKDDQWKTITIRAKNNQSGAKIKISYFRLNVEEYVSFNNQTISLKLGIKNK